MAKSAKSAKKAQPKKTVQKHEKTTPDTVSADNTSQFELFEFTDVPARTRTGGGARSPYPFPAMSVGQGFFVAATVDTSDYADEEEGRRAEREECRRIVNRLAGATRRFTKQNEGYRFAVRTTQHEGSWGVWVGRIEE